MTFAKRNAGRGRQGKLEVIYKLKAEIPIQNDLNGTLKKAIDVILRVIREHYAERLPDEAGAYRSFALNSPKLKADCVSMPQRHLWTIRLKCSIATPNEPDRWWLFDLGLLETEQHLLFGLQICTESPPGVAIRFSPFLVTALADECGLKQFLPLNGQPLVIRDPMFVDELYDLLSMRERTLPVVVISEVNFRLWEYSKKPANYLVNPLQLAKQLQGYAHVVQLSYQAAQEWSHRAGSTWAVYDGAVRIFAPRFNIEYSLPGEHIIHYKNDIWNWENDAQIGSGNYAAYLSAVVKKMIPAQYVDWRGVYLLPEAQIVQLEFKKFMENSETGNPLYEKELEEKLQTQENETAFLREERNRLTKEVQRQNGVISEYQKQVSALQSSIESLTGFRAEPDDENLPEESIPIPAGYGEMSTWAQLYLPNKLIILPRAERSLDKAEYRSPELVYQALLLLAFEYRNSRLGESDDKPFKEKCTALGLECRGAITKSRAGGIAGDTYYVNYPAGTPKRELLKFQLQKGVSRNKRYCLRIYFFWDETAKLVVVGDLPGHLTNRVS